MEVTLSVIYSAFSCGENARDTDVQQLIIFIVIYFPIVYISFEKENIIISISESPKSGYHFSKQWWDLAQQQIQNIRNKL